jgi:hypothetical protein
LFSSVPFQFPSLLPFFLFPTYSCTFRSAEGKCAGAPSRTDTQTQSQCLRLLAVRDHVICAGPRMCRSCGHFGVLHAPLLLRPTN